MFALETRTNPTIIALPISFWCFLFQLFALFDDKIIASLIEDEGNCYHLIDQAIKNQSHVDYFNLGANSV